MHGLLVWALSIVAGGLLAFLAAGALGNSGAHVAAGAMSNRDAVVAPAIDTLFGASVRANCSRSRRHANTHSTGSHAGPECRARHRRARRRPR